MYIYLLQNLFYMFIGKSVVRNFMFKVWSLRYNSLSLSEMPLIKLQFIRLGVASDG